LAHLILSLVQFGFVVLNEEKSSDDGAFVKRRGWGGLGGLAGLLVRYAELCASIFGVRGGILSWVSGFLVTVGDNGNAIG
jgi:hypothetical protein